MDPDVLVRFPRSTQGYWERLRRMPGLRIFRIAGLRYVIMKFVQREPVYFSSGPIPVKPQDLLTIEIRFKRFYTVEEWVELCRSSKV